MASGQGIQLEREVMNLTDFRRDVLHSMGVLQWLIETTGMAEDEILTMVDEDFQQLLSRVGG